MGKVYACSDLHGCFNLWEKIQEILQPDDKVIYLGDAIDRGPDSFKLMMSLLRDSRVEYLLGNHEDMMVRALREKFFDELSWDNATYIWYSNGGNLTDQQILEHFDRNQINSLCDTITHLNQNIEYKNKNGQTIYLHHAGGNYEDFQNPAKLSVWDREHIYSKTHWDGPEDVFIVHGHTPVEYFNENFRTIYKYCDGHKIDIDMGAVFFGITCLLDLDTLEPIYIKGE